MGNEDNAMIDVCSKLKQIHHLGIGIDNISEDLSYRHGKMGCYIDKYG